MNSTANAANAMEQLQNYIQTNSPQVCAIGPFSDGRVNFGLIGG
jgi:hypothetical protein